MYLWCPGEPCGLLHRVLATLSAGAMLLTPLTISSAQLETAASLLADANHFWSRELRALGGQYQAPGFVQFDGHITGACSADRTLSESFYCPSTGTIYFDAQFARLLQARSAQNADAALAYVIGREVGHHVQNLLGTTAVVEQARARSTPELSARTWTTAELQADCYAGLWLHSAMQRQVVKMPSEVAGVLDAASALTREQMAHLASGQVIVDPINYGTPAQRIAWFQRGLNGASTADCDTFKAEQRGML